MNIRRLEGNDYNLGYVELLSELTKVGNISKENWIERFNTIKYSNLIEIWVIHDTDSNKIIATGTILIEPKFIHNCGKVGHIEDIVTSKKFNGKGLGKKIINLLTERAKINDCYKVILDCSEHNVGFYEKCGFSVKGREMSLYCKL
jgi:glucosamine-phosphate N-acetyltransferase